MRFLFLAIFSACLTAWCQRMDTCTIQEKTLTVTTPIRVKAFAEKAELINNMLSWHPLASIVNDGSLVKEGQVIATYNRAELQHQMNSLLLRKELIQANLKQRLGSIDSKNLEMDENMEALQDKLAALTSKLARQSSEPTQDDIRMVDGRLKIAAMNYEAAKKDYEKAQDRFKREFISRAELETKEKDLSEKQQKYLFAQKEKEVTCNPPARADNMRLTQLDIEITKLEIDKLTYEIQEQRDISEIQRRGAIVNQERNNRQISERQQDLDHIIIKSPISGVVSLRRPYGKIITPGDKMWYGLCFIEIPDLKTIAFKGILPESRRRFYKENDAVIIRMNGHMDTPLKGKIKFISTLSHDIAEKEDEGSSGKTNLGVKVFDITIAIDEKKTPDWLLPGIFGEAELLTTQKLAGPSLPIRFIKQVGSKTFISINGKYQEVTGTRLDSEFLLDDPKLIGQKVQMGGILPEQKNEDKSSDYLLRASGEIQPIKSQKIMVQNIGRGPWCEVTWLIPEETYVKKGDVVAKLDTTERDKYVQAAEESATEYRSRQEELEKNLVITRRTGEFSQKVARCRLEAAQINLKKNMTIQEPLPLYKAEMELQLALIQEKYQTGKWQREKAKKTPTVSPVELRKMERDLERARLNAEKARIELDIQKEGATKINRSAAELALFEAQKNKLAIEKQAEFNNISIKRRYERSCVHLQRAEKRVQHRKQNVENLTIKSPADGLICYSKINTNGIISKIAVGTTVGQSFNILSIPDMNQMEITVELDEKYFSGIREGMKVNVKFPSLGERKLQGIVSKTDLLFYNKAKKDSQIGLYSSHEPLGEVIFRTHILIDTANLQLKPGLVGDVIFPIPR